MTDSFNKLSPAEDERLAWLLEEFGEALQCIGKIQRHGYESEHPNGYDPGLTNRMRLEREIGDIMIVISLLFSFGDLRSEHVHRNDVNKVASLKKYSHHQDWD